MPLVVWLWLTLHRGARPWNGSYRYAKIKHCVTGTLKPP
jgi:hypothetical protein